MFLSFVLGFALFANAGSTQAPDILKELGIQTKLEKSYPQQLQGFDSADPHIYLLSVHLGQLNQTQFTKLKAYFGNQSSVSFDSNRSYDLKDFLPPAMQALLNKKLNDMDLSSFDCPKDEYGDEEDCWLLRANITSVSSMVNCIGTAFEMSRIIQKQNGAGTYHLYSPGRVEASYILKDKSNGASVPQKNLKFGDVLYYTQKLDTVWGEQVQHMAIFIAGNIYFEKRDSSEQDPYRLVLLEDVQKRLENVFEDKRIKPKLLRFRESAFKKMIPENGSHQKAQERLFDNENELDPDHVMKKMFDNASPEIRNALLSIEMDEVGLGGGAEIGLSIVERITITPQNEKVEIQGNPKTLIRIKDAF